MNKLPIKTDSINKKNKNRGREREKENFDDVIPYKADENRQIKE